MKERGPEVQKGAPSSDIVTTFALFLILRLPSVLELGITHYVVICSVVVVVVSHQVMVVMVIQWWWRWSLTQC